MIDMKLETEKLIAQRTAPLLAALKALHQQVNMSEIAFSAANIHARSVISEAEGRS